MNEAQLNTIIGNSLDWKHKISDGGRHGLLPFDGFGILNNQPIYWEAKFLRKPESFNFNKLQDHQIENLLQVQNLLPNNPSWFIIGVNFGRADKRVFLFRDMNYIKKRKEEGNNILKKEFERRKNYVTIKKQLINFKELLSLPMEYEYDLPV